MAAWWEISCLSDGAFSTNMSRRLDGVQHEALLALEPQAQFVHAERQLMVTSMTSAGTVRKWLA